MMVRYSRLSAAVLAVGLCLSAPHAYACKNDDECKAGRVCLNGMCSDPPSEQSCRVDIECPDDAVCENGRCRAPDDQGTILPAPSQNASRTQVLTTSSPAASPASTPAATAAAAPRVQPGYVTERRPLVPLLIAGPVTFGVAWLATIGGTAALADEGSTIGIAAIPLAGPWVLMATRDTDPYSPALVVSGILQLGGLTMTILGAALTREVQIPIAETAALDLHVAPIVGEGLAGIGASGTF